MNLLALSISSQNKNYLEDRVPFTAHFMPSAVAMNISKVIILQGAMFGAKAAETIAESEEEEETPHIELPSLRVFSSSCFFAYAKNTAITTTQRILEYEAIRYFNQRTAGKMIKNISKSALSKFSRTHSRATTASLIYRTTLRANSLYHIAIFLVEEAIIIYGLYERKEKEKGANRINLQILREQTMLKLQQMTGAILAAAAGAMIGTLIKPGLGTSIGAILGDSLAYVALQ